MKSLFKPASWFSGKSNSKRGEENSFQEKIAVLKSRAGSAEITEAETVAEELDELLHRIQDEAEKNDCLRALAEVCLKHAVLPRSYIILDVEETKRWKIGGVADLWAGKLGQSDICIKTFRQYEDENQRKIKGALYHHAVWWKSLSHENVHRFLGISGPETVAPFGLVTPKMPSNITSYIAERQNVDRLRLLRNAARGLAYLHSRDIVHGRINPRNVLITGEGKACIGDFGIVDIISNSAQSGTTSRKRDGLRYMTPEQLNNGPPGKESDVHSFAITAYEVLAEAEAYSGTDEGRPLGTRITSGVQPIRPMNPVADRWLSNETWEMLGSCWALDPSARPVIEGCIKCFKDSRRITWIRFSRNKNSQENGSKQ